jgi:hypothetical protein
MAECICEALFAICGLLCKADCDCESCCECDCGSCDCDCGNCGDYCDCHHGNDGKTGCGCCDWYLCTMCTGPTDTTHHHATHMDSIVFDDLSDGQHQRNHQQQQQKKYEENPTGGIGLDGVMVTQPTAIMMESRV